MSRRRWSDEELVAAVRDVADRCREPLTSLAYDSYRRRGEPSPSTLVERFGSWQTVLERAGVPAAGRSGTRWTADAVVEVLARWLAESSDQRMVRYVAEAARREDLPGINVIRARYGGWRVAVAEAQALTTRVGKRRELRPHPDRPCSPSDLGGDQRDDCPALSRGSRRQGRCLRINAPAGPALLTSVVGRASRVTSRCRSTGQPCSSGSTSGDAASEHLAGVSRACGLRPALAATRRYGRPW